MLSEYENKLHLAAVTCSSNFLRSQNDLIKVLIRIERRRFYKKFNRRNLLDYIVKDLKIDSTYLFELNRVAQKAIEFPVLAKALIDEGLRVGHAGRIVSKLTPENAGEWVEFAKAHTFEEVREQIARSNPEKLTREIKKRLSGDQTRISFVATDALAEKLERVQALLAQRGKNSKIAHAIEELCDLYLKREDPVEKAKRSQARPIKITLRQNVHTSIRVPFTAAERHAVMLKSGGRCTFTDHEGRCNSQRHTEIHHILPVSEGGTNSPDNLTLICSHHHDWVHQMSFPGMEMPWTFANEAQPAAGKAVNLTEPYNVYGRSCGRFRGVS